MSGSKQYTDTFAADGDGSIYRVGVPDGNASVEPIGFTMIGTWSTATLTLHLCADITASPLVFAAVPDGAYTADTGDKWDMPTGCYFKIVASGGGSPTLDATVNGDIRIVQ